MAQLVKNPPAMRETWIRSLGWEDPLEKGKATHSNIQAWRIPWTVWSMGLQRIGHNWATCPLAFFHTVFVFARLIWLSMISSRSIRVVVNSKISFLLIAEQYSSVCVCVCVCTHTYYIFIHSSVNGSLGCFHNLASVNNAAVYSGVHTSFQISIFFPLRINTQE